MARHAAVSVDNDLASGEAAVAHGAADDEHAGRVDVVARVGAQPLGGKHFLDDEVHHRLVDVGLADALIVLRRQYHRINTHRLAILVAQGHLAFGIGAQPGQRAVLAQLRLPLYQTVGVEDGRGHESFGFIGGVAEHQALVAGTLFLVVAGIDALGDVRALLANGIENSTGRAIEADFRAVVADVQHHVAHHVLEVDVGFGGHLAGNHHHAGLDQGLHRNARIGVVDKDLVEDGVGDLVGHFVGVPFGH